MTLYVHTTEQDSYCEIQWVMATSSAGGVMKITIGPNEDRPYWLKFSRWAFYWTDIQAKLAVLKPALQA